MANYSEKDIQVLDNAMAFIRKTPSRFFGYDPTGADFVARVVKDLILLDVGSIV
jgi:hypothetical protein